ncbi:hypothetical protein GQR58_007242 [Nymphon striatum]|nr:hypothetical protein GQR58_007242 [Nymphon striatum]
MHEKVTIYNSTLHFRWRTMFCYPALQVFEHITLGSMAHGHHCAVCSAQVIKDNPRHMISPCFEVNEFDKGSCRKIRNCSTMKVIYLIVLHQPSPDIDSIDTVSDLGPMLDLHV